MAQLASSNHEQERRAVERTIEAFRSYAESSELELERRRRNLRALEASSKKDAMATVDRVREVYARNERLARRCVEKNQLFFNQMVAAFEREVEEEGGGAVPQHLRVEKKRETKGAEGMREASRASSSSFQTHRLPLPKDAEKARYVLRNLVRDWSEEGSEERVQSHKVLCEHLEERFQEALKKAKGERFASAAEAAEAAAEPPRVLVPGAGLGRLVYELAKIGFETEGNEFSYYMLFAASFVLNCCDEQQPFRIAPYWHTPLNHASFENQYREVIVPDESPGANAHKFTCGSMAMCAGDFVEVYGAKEYENAFDAVACCFFLDTAKNIIEYLETIKSCLRKNGTFCSIGPLLWHWVEHTENDFCEASRSHLVSRATPYNDENKRI